MAILALDLGGTKLAHAVFSVKGKLMDKRMDALGERKGGAVGRLIQDVVALRINEQSDDDPITSVGICVPGIYNCQTQRVWAPNIDGWEDFPLADEIRKVSKGAAVYVDSDRSCCILGEVWQGNAKNNKDAIFITVGTGIGAGIIADGHVIRGAHDIAGAIGWMALEKPYASEYDQCGHFEYYASGDGIARTAVKMLNNSPDYAGILSEFPQDKLTAHHVFSAYQNDDIMAMKVISYAIELWGMATANLVSIFNPEKIIFGGGMFGPAAIFINQIQEEAEKWAQPISMKKVSLSTSELGSDAGLYGAAYLALSSKSNS